MRGSVAFQAALGLLWSSSPALVGAAAIEPVSASFPSEPVHFAAPVARDEGEFRPRRPADEKAAVADDAPVLVASVDGAELEDDADETARAIMQFEFPGDSASEDDKEKLSNFVRAFLPCAS
jgi:hypothetical protein